MAEHVKPGDFATPAWSQNEIVDHVNAARLTDATNRHRQDVSRNVIKVKNSSGADRGRGQVLKVDDFLLTDFDKSQFSLWYDGILPTSSTDCVAVLLEPIQDGKIGPAQIDGVCVGRVNLTDITHTRAAPASATSILQSGTTGPFKVIGNPTGVAEQDVGVVFSSEVAGTLRGYVTGSDYPTLWSWTGTKYAPEFSIVAAKNSSLGIYKLFPVQDVAAHPTYYTTDGSRHDEGTTADAFSIFTAKSTPEWIRLPSWWSSSYPTYPVAEMRFGPCRLKALTYNGNTLEQEDTFAAWPGLPGFRCAAANSLTAFTDHKGDTRYKMLFYRDERAEGWGVAKYNWTKTVTATVLTNPFVWIWPTFLSTPPSKADITNYRVSGTPFDSTYDGSNANNPAGTRAEFPDLSITASIDYHQPDVEKADLVFPPTNGITFDRFHPNITKGHYLRYINHVENQNITYIARLILSTDIWDDPIYTLRLTASYPEDGHGWAVADGVGNSTGNFGSGRNYNDKLLMGVLTAGVGGDTAASGSDIATQAVWIIERLDNSEDQGVV